jgi:hypothetical protein
MGCGARTYRVGYAEKLETAGLRREIVRKWGKKIIKKYFSSVSAFS